MLCYSDSVPLGLDLSGRHASSGSVLKMVTSMHVSFEQLKCCITISNSTKCLNPASAVARTPFDNASSWHKGTQEILSAYCTAACTRYSLDQLHVFCVSSILDLGMLATGHETSLSHRLLRDMCLYYTIRLTLQHSSTCHAAGIVSGK